MHESVDNYRKIEENKLPTNIQNEFENPDTTAVIQSCETGEILKSFIWHGRPTGRSHHT